MTQSQDVVTKLLRDHQQVKKMFADIEKAPDARMGETFWHLTNELVRHEVAEEEVIYPEVRRVIPNGDRLSDARIKEQAEAEELLAKMEKADAQAGGVTAGGGLKFPRRPRAVTQPGGRVKAPGL